MKTWAAEEKSPFRVRNEIEIPLLIGMAAITAGPTLFQAEMPKSEQAPLLREKVFFLDRSATYHHSQTAINLSAYLTAAIPITAGVASMPWGDKKWTESYEDLLMISESTAFTSLTNQVVRNAVRRPRPYLYQHEEPYPVSDREDNSSFFSGHTAMAFTVGISYWHIHQIRRPNDPSNPYILAAVLTTGTVMAVARVFSGYHFWTDVGVGGIVGAAIGYVVPELHRLDDGQPGSVTFAPMGVGGLAVGYRI